VYHSELSELPRGFALGGRATLRAFFFFGYNASFIFAERECFYAQGRSKRKPRFLASFSIPEMGP
jgi:hypothetical protein